MNCVYKYDWVKLLIMPTTLLSFAIKYKNINSDLVIGWMKKLKITLI